jgi:tRNA pseudouridine38-40 synthase
MVRTIVGTILNIGQGRISPEGVSAIFDAKDRRAAGPTVPARGLHLMKVEY